ncbi:MAG: hypothetical protein K6G31_10280 [Paludibacteraceae bacterium]|nr:hypothetical protein [Paludibacteraceae bacterium]
MKKTGLILSLIVACLALPACDNDDNNDPTPVSDVSTRIVANWQMTNKTFVTVDESGEVQKTEGNMMVSEIWEFSKDGYQYVTLDGYAATELYRYEIKGNELTLIQDVEDTPEIRHGVVRISNGTMVLDLYDEGSKTEYTEYIFQQVM